MPQQALEEYNAYYGVRNPAAMPILRKAQRQGSCTVLAREVVGVHEYRASEYYTDWGRKYGSFWTVIGAFAQESGRVTSLSLMRPEQANPLGQNAVGC